MRLLAIVLATLFPLVLGGATTPAAKGNWLRVVNTTADNSHVLGNPDARLKLTEFISYTCPRCAEFEVQSEAQLKLTFLAKGEGSIEVRHFVRDPVDLTVALLTNCGPKEKFFANHAAFLRSQPKWIGPLQRVTPQLRQRWSAGEFRTRTRNIAQDLGFYPMMRARGYTSAQVDACLADEALANRLAEQRQQDAERLGVQGTPSFAINGVLLAGAHDWAALAPELRARMGR